MKTSKVSRLFADDGGEGRTELPIVFLHSLAGNTQHWEAQLRHARQTRRAIALDLCGHGRSPAADGDFALESLAQDVHTTLHELDVERFILVGHSLGGSVAVAYAGSYQQQVAGLLLVDPSGDSTQLPTEQVQGLLGALQSEAYTAVIEEYWQQILTGATEATQAQVMHDLHKMDKATVVGMMQALLSYKPTPALQKYAGQRLSVITPINQAPFSLHNLVPDFPHTVIGGTSHWLHMDKPEQFNEIMDAFILAVSATAKSNKLVPPPIQTRVLRKRP
ncbi:alpha/beta fold hydrolase [Candidatus Leptofilum sp.]|uniref:alpha/beta fold hydrolase n=1 Tax=Candidatus Leptofilum sp. TaxID=3241576 RepID=UPI003B5CF6BE